MAFSTQDLANVCAAIASGELTVKVNDRLVTYRSFAELVQAKNLIEQDLAASTTAPKSGVFTLRFATSRGM